MYENVVQWVMEYEPLLARVFSGLALTYMIGMAGLRVYSRWGMGTTEQQELFKFLKGLLTSSNGWLRPDSASIKYACLTGATKPEVKIGTNSPSIYVGNETVHSNGRLTKGQIRRLTALAKKVADELDAQARAGEINRLLAVLR